MTITLGDVACLLGIPIDGAPLTNPDPVDYLSLCQELLGLTPPADEWWGNEMIHTLLFRQQFVDGIPADAIEIQIQQRARAVILHIICSRLICDHSKTQI